MGKKLKKGFATGKGDPSGMHGDFSSFKDDGTGPKKPMGSISHPGPSNTGSEGMVKPGAKLTPKGSM